MDKRNFYKAKLNLKGLLNVDLGICFEMASKETYENIIDFFDREVIKAARELLAVVDEREEDKDPLAPYATYVSDIKFHNDGTATIKYNGGSLGRVVEVFAKGTKYEKDTD